MTHVGPLDDDDLTFPPPPEYSGEDLEILASLHRYRTWIVDAISPHVQGQVAEIGAGIGSFTADLLRLPTVRHIDVVEPSPPLFAHLQARFTGEERITVIPRMCEEWSVKAEAASLDTVVMINVLEHIEDDLAVVNSIRQALRPGGKLVIFVPAMMFLFSELDRFYGHFRRYQRPGLAELMEKAGMTVLENRYFDLLGVLPWLVMNRWLGKIEFNPKQIALYDRIGIPITRTIETLIRPPFGKNLLLVAQRKAG
ncbi:class I SAM-dependent methyltransferase [Paramagnetospirillum caucaseum]|nr:class I SAM-dependent methyltransferase [Paramagnetospirillum caucaseum]